MTTTFIDFKTEFASFNARIVNEIVNLLDSNNLTALDLCTYTKGDHYTSIPHEYNNVLPSVAYCENGGDYQTCFAYRLEKHFNVWDIRWNDDCDGYVDYELKFATEDDFKDRRHFMMIERNTEQLIKLYNRVWELVNNEVSSK